MTMSSEERMSATAAHHEPVLSGKYKQVLETIHQAEEMRKKAKAFEQNSKVLLDQVIALASDTEPDDPAVAFLKETHTDSVQEANELVSSHTTELYLVNKIHVEKNTLLLFA